VPLSNHKEQEAKLQEIQREINILQKIEEISPKPSSIIPFYGYYISENASKDQDFCFVFEHLNQSLNTLIEEHRQSNESFSIAELMKFYKQILFGMAFLQNLQVTHRDLKPGNMLLDSQNNIKINDFGVSVNISDLMKNDHQDTLATFAAQMQFDLETDTTTLYFSPEILRKWTEFKQNHKKNDTLLHFNPYKSDVFSFGLILLEAATLRQVNHKDDLTRLETKIQEHLDIFSQIHAKLEGKEFHDFKFLWKRIGSCLKMNADDRPDFLTLFKADFDEPKIPFHISIEEMSLQQNKERFGDNLEQEEKIEIQALKEENQRLKKENLDLRKTQKTAEIDVLKNENLALTQENWNLRHEINTLKKENKKKLELKKNDNPAEFLSQPKCEIDPEKKNKFALTQENWNLKQEINALKNEKKVYIQEIDEFKQEINWVKIKKISFKIMH